MNGYKLILEKWRLPDLYQDEEQITHNAQTTIDVVKSLQKEKSATLSIATERDTLNINASQGLFAIGRQSHDGQYFDLVGDETAVGRIPYIVSGQIVEFPRRYLIPFDAVLAVVRTFLAHGTIDLQNGKWEYEWPDDQ